MHIGKQKGLTSLTDIDQPISSRAALQQGGSNTVPAATLSAPSEEAELAFLSQGKSPGELLPLQIQQIQAKSSLLSALRLEEQKNQEIRNIFHNQEYSHEDKIAYICSLTCKNQYYLLKYAFDDVQSTPFWESLPEHIQTAYHSQGKPLGDLAQMDVDGKITPEEEKVAITDKIADISDGFDLMTCLIMKSLKDKKKQIKEMLHKQDGYTEHGKALYINALDPSDQYYLLRYAFSEEQRKSIWPYLSEEAELAYEYPGQSPAEIAEELQRSRDWNLSAFSDEELSQWTRARVAEAIRKDDRTIIYESRRALRAAGHLERAAMLEMPLQLEEKHVIKRAEKKLVKSTLTMLQTVPPAAFNEKHRRITDLLNAHLVEGEPLKLQELLELLDSNIAEFNQNTQYTSSDSQKNNTGKERETIEIPELLSLLDADRQISRPVTRSSVCNRRSHRISEHSKTCRARRHTNGYR